MSIGWIGSMDKAEVVEGTPFLTFLATGPELDRQGERVSKAVAEKVVDAGKAGTIFLAPSHDVPIQLAKSVDGWTDEGGHAFLKFQVDREDPMAMKTFKGFESGSWVPSVSLGAEKVKRTVSYEMGKAVKTIEDIETGDPGKPVHLALAFPSRNVYPLAGFVEAMQKALKSDASELEKRFWPKEAIEKALADDLGVGSWTPPSFIARWQAQEMRDALPGMMEVLVSTIEDILNPYTAGDSNAKRVMVEESVAEFLDEVFEEAEEREGSQKASDAAGSQEGQVQGMLKGDVPGHEFRGNKHTGGIGAGAGKASASAERASLKAQARSEMAQHGTGSHRGAGSAHSYASAAHKVAGDAHAGTNPEKAKYHYGRSEEHLGQAEEHWDQHEASVAAKSCPRPKTGMAKGDVPGHEFHGNQYTDGGAAAGKADSASERAKNASESANNWPSKREHAQATLAHVIARDSHDAASKVAVSDEVRSHHEAQRDAHGEAAKSHSSESMKYRKSARSDGAMSKGDVPGHEFHGNQYTGGGGGDDDEEGRSTSPGEVERDLAGMVGGETFQEAGILASDRGVVLRGKSVEEAHAEVGAALNEDFGPDGDGTFEQVLDMKDTDYMTNDPGWVGVMPSGDEIHFNFSQDHGGNATVTITHQGNRGRNRWAMPPKEGMGKAAPPADPPPPEKVSASAPPPEVPPPPEEPSIPPAPPQEPEPKPEDPAVKALREQLARVEGELEALKKSTPAPPNVVILPNLDTDPRTAPAAVTGLAGDDAGRARKSIEDRIASLRKSIDSTKDQSIRGGLIQEHGALVVKLSRMP